MTMDEKILDELKEQTKLMRAGVFLLTEIKFELQNQRVMKEAAGSTYKIKVKESWIDRLKAILKRK